jgi:hypothetical protein
MNSSQESVDPAAVFACAVSLREACEAMADKEQANLSALFNGIDEFWRVMMRIGTLFEAWAYENVAFEAMTDVWPYLLMDRFGEACLASVPLEAMADLGSDALPVVAMAMEVPLIYREGCNLPLDLEAPNPVAGSFFVRWRIQTVRGRREEAEMEPMWYGEDPHDPEYEPPVVALYGVDATGTLEHVRDSVSYAEARSLVMKLAPGVVFPEVPVIRLER